MKKIIKLINNERLNKMLLSKQAIETCLSGAVDICPHTDTAKCTLYSYDSCSKEDYAGCTKGADDTCTIDYTACSGPGAEDNT